MADYDVNLSQFHWRVWQDELGLSGTISEYGHIEFGRQGPGILRIALQKSKPGRAQIDYELLDYRFDDGLTKGSALDVCNSVNVFSSSGAMLVQVGGTIYVQLHLFYLPLDDTGALPDEGFLRAWIGPAMSEIEIAARAFAAEWKKQAE